MAPAWPVTDMPPPWCSQTDMLLFLRLWVRGTPALPSLQTDLPVCWVNFTLPCAILILFIAGGCVTSLFSVCSSLLPDVNPGRVIFWSHAHQTLRNPSGSTLTCLPGLPCSTGTPSSQMYLKTKESQAMLSSSLTQVTSNDVTCVLLLFPVS